MKNRFTLVLGMLLSAVVLLALPLSSANAQTYCTPSNSSSTDGIGIVMTQNGLTNFNNSSGFTSGGYAAYLDDSVTVMQGNSFTLQAQSNGSSSYYWSVWVDWNDDGDFDDQNEQVYVNNNSTSTSVTATIYVSYAVSAGRKRMRVIGGNTSITDACMSSTSIEGEDYTLRVTAAPACSGQPTAGGIASSPIYTICPNLSFSLTDTGATGASNMTYQWQERNPSGTGTWTDIAGAVNFNLDFPNGINSSTDYRFYVVCNNSNQSDTSNVVQVVMNDSTDCYCTPDVYNASGFYQIYISAVQSTGGAINLNNTNNGYGASGYQDFRNTDTLEVMAGNQVTLTPLIASANSYNPYVGLSAWIDWNHDGDFDDAGEQVANLQSQAMGSSYASTFAVPLLAQPGHTTLRIIAFPYDDGFDPCGNSITSSYSGEAEDYTVIIDSMPGCASATFPSSVEALVDMDTLCVSGDITLDLDTAFYFSSVTYQWQESSTGSGSWTDIGSPQMGTTKSITGVNSDTWYRCEILCNGNNASTSSIIHVHINDPQLTGTPQGGTRCGPGTVGLSATTTSGYTVNWYETPTGGTPVATGTSVQSPYIVQTDTFWAAAGVGQGGGGIGGVLITEMNIGAPDGLEIQNVSGSSVDITGWKLAISDDYSNITTVNSIVLTLNGVLNPGDILSWTDASGGSNYWGNNILWDPTGKGWALLLDANNNVVDFVSQDWPETTIQTTTLNISGTPIDLNGSWVGAGLVGSSVGSNSFQRIGSSDNDNATDFVSAPPTMGTQNTNITMPFSGFGCEGGREPVVAVVTPGPPFEISYDSVICNNTLRPINVTSPLSNYTDGYTWTIVDSVGELFTDAAGTTPYVSGTSASTVYFRSTTSGLNRVAVHASNGPAQSDCAAADTADIWVQPGNITIDAMPDTICISGSTDLTLVPDSNYALGSIQWQESGDGINYNNIPGATNVEYTTVNLTTAHYYRAVITAVAGICETPDVHMVVANPIIINVNDSFNCGPGSVTLTGTPGQNTNMRWYDEPDGGNLLGTGNTFNTPVLTQTDTFYAAAGVGQAGSAGGDSVNVPLANGTTTGIYDHMFKINAINQTTINAIGIKCNNSAGTSTGWDVYYRPDDYSTVPGANTSSNGWILISSQTGVISQGASAYTEIASGLTVSIPANTTYSFYIHPASGTTHQYSSPSTGTVVASNADLELIAGNRGSGLFNCTSSGGMATVNVKYGMGSGCESPRVPVVAEIYPKPEVDLGADINECVDSGTALALDAGVQQYNPQFLWDNNTTSQVRSINQSGIYYVTVTNSYSCKDTDTIDIVLRNNPDVDLGGDTTVCENTSVTLDAGDDGIQYFWNTGDNSQTITVNTPGTYNVLVTNDEGCTDGDTVTVDMSGQLPHYDGIMVTNNGVDSFTFNPLNPQGVVGYEWDMGDGTPHKFGPVVHHKYNQSGTYIVTLFATSECGSYSDSTSAHILGIGDLNLDNNQLAVYPNPTKDKATIVTKGVKMEKIAVYNVLGQKIYEAKADNPYEHKLDLSGVASGVYNIRVYTESGMATRKLNVLK